MDSMFTRIYIYLGLILVGSIACSPSSHSDEQQAEARQFTRKVEKVIRKAPLSFRDSLLMLFKDSLHYMGGGFSFPVGKPPLKGYYDAQPFGRNLHVGNDWNAVTGGNSDLGDPIYAIGNGLCLKAKDYKGGWGKVVCLAHAWQEGDSSLLVMSLYAHCDSMEVKEGDWVKKREQIATIGNAGGIYYAHLHLEIRDSLELPLGGGYATQTAGYLDPTSFIRGHQK
ncbi:MAG: M23 family metallopeptidase [Bacteroidota bacterium]